MIEAVDANERRGRAQLVLVHPRFLHRKAELDALGFMVGGSWHLLIEELSRFLLLA